MCGNQEGKGGGRVNWETGVDVSVYPYKTSNKNLLYNIGNAIQCSVGSKREGSLKKEGSMYMHN